MEKKSPKSHKMKIPMAKSPLPKSPMPRSPMPKSPMPKSPIPKSPMYEKYKSRCAYGLISFFRFRRRHSKKLISDADYRSLSRHALDDQQFDTRLDLRSGQYVHDGVDEKTVMVDSGNVKVNKTKRDVCIEPQMKKKITTAKVENVKSDSEHIHRPSRKNVKATKTARRPRRLPIYGCYDVSTIGHINSTHQNVGERSLKSLDSPAAAEVHPKNGKDCNCKSTNCMQCNKFNEINLQVNLNEATKAFINQKLTDGRNLSSDGTSHQSKHFLDALEVLNSNKDLFIKLLQDPNSLLVKHIEDLRESQEKEQQTKSSTNSELLEHQISTTKEGGLPKETSNCQHLENIVVLKPCWQSLQHLADKTSPDSLQTHYSPRNVQQNAKPAFFPFEVMKRKLMQAMKVSREKQQLLLTDGAVHLNSAHGMKGFEQCRKEIGMKIISINSSKNASSDCGGLTSSSTDVMRKHQMVKVDESDIGVGDEAGSDSPRGLEISCLSAGRQLENQKHDACIEPRMDISELINGNMNFLRKQRAKTWDGITSVPDYDFLPMINSGRIKENVFLSPQNRIPPYRTHQIVSGNHSRNQGEKKNSCSSPLRQNVEATPWAVNRKQYKTKPDISDSLYHDVQQPNGISSINIDLSQIETSNSENSEDISPNGMTSKSDSSCNNGVNQSSKILDTCEEGESLTSSRMVSPVENQTSISSLDDYLSSPSHHQSLKEFNIIRDNSEQPSPVSVLDQLFTEDVNSPLNTESQPTPPSVRQLQIDSEEGCLAAHQSPLGVNIISSDSIEEYGSMSNYISRVLQASRFTWDELSWKCCFSDQLLDQSLFEDIDVWASQCCSDHRLIFDYVNEVVIDASLCYLRCSPWLSFIKPRILPAILETGSIVHEVMKYVDWNLLLVRPSETLEKIIEMDLKKSGRWMDIRIDAEDAVNEMMDSLLEELTIEIAFQ